MIWSRRAKITLAIGVVTWLVAVALTPGELGAAKRRAKLRPRTVATVLAYAVAAVLVLAGLPRRDAHPELPQK